MPPTALIDFPARPTEAGSPRLRLAFDAPRLWLVAQTLQDVRPVIDEAQRQAESGRWCVGHVRYEAAAAFDPALETACGDGQALACFAVFDAARAWPDALTADTQDFRTDPWQDGWSQADFDTRVESIRESIRGGEVYQVNLTTRLHGLLHGDPLAWFQALLRGQPDGYALYLAHGGPDEHGREQRLLSVSPELFFHWRDGRLLSQPMKGTAARGATPAADEAAARTLAASEKERAENLMIVDLLRNDFARLAQTGSVRVPRLFELHALPTVWQMTSTIEARTRPGLRLSDLFAALFPCGSVTGAPKIAAMRRIRALEAGARGIYCGAAGVIAPGGAATFNVPIRSVELQQAGDGGTPWRSRCGIGSGITLDATPAGEAAEWRAKRRFLERAAAPFDLLESLRLEDGRIWLLDEHLARLDASARALDHPCDSAAVRRALRQAAAQHPRGAFKLRLLLDALGRITVQADVLSALPGAADGRAARAALATRPIAADGEFIRHKTTRREAYAPFAPPPGCIDTLLWNEAGELTEFTIGNLALLLDGRWLTPEAGCGLLPGTYRARLLAQGTLQEARLRRGDLRRAQAAAFLNSVRGWIALDLAALQAASAQLGQDD